MSEVTSVGQTTTYKTSSIYSWDPKQSDAEDDGDSPMHARMLGGGGGTNARVS